MRNLCLISSIWKNHRRSGASPDSLPVDDEKSVTSKHQKKAYRNRFALKPKLDPERSLWPSCFLFEDINSLKRQMQLKPEKTASGKNRNKES
jgi:hypothetical protein